MMKYIFCILLGVFLNWGFHLISDEAQEAYRLETGSTSIQTYTKSYTSKTNMKNLSIGFEEAGSSESLVYG